MNSNGNDFQPGKAAAFLYRILAPLIRILIRLGYTANTTSDMVRWAYVKSFYETPEFWRHEQPTALQCSLKTGISRAEIPGLLAIDTPEDVERQMRRNVAARILFSWWNDPDFSCEGKALVLPISSPPGPSFRRLVARYGADARYQNVLDDLQKAGCVESTENTVSLIHATYGFNAVDIDKLGLAADMTGDLLATTAHNLDPSNHDCRRLQRFWWQARIAEHRLEDAHALIKRMGERFGRELDTALAELAEKDGDADARSIHVGFGIYGYQREAVPVERDENKYE